MRRHSCQARYGSVTTSSRFGHCRTSGKCARLRTIERETSATGTPSRNIYALWVNIEQKRPTHRRWETQIARKDAMPHERGSLPLLPSEFSITTLADPKPASAARSPTVNQRLISRQGISLTLKHLETAHHSSPGCLAQPRPTDDCVPLNLSSRRPVQLRSIPQESGMSR